MLVNPAPASNVAKTDDDANVTKNASNFSFTIPPKYWPDALPFLLFLSWLRLPGRSSVGPIAYAFVRPRAEIAQGRSSGQKTRGVSGATPSLFYILPYARETANRRTASRLLPR